MSFKAELKKGKILRGREETERPTRATASGPPSFLPFGLSLPVTSAKAFHRSASVSSATQGGRVSEPLSALLSGAVLSWLTPGLGTRPSWLRQPGGRWAFVAASWGSCGAFVPGKGGGLGGGTFCDSGGVFLFPTVLEEGGWGMGGATMAPLLPSSAADGPRPPLP